MWRSGPRRSLWVGTVGTASCGRSMAEQVLRGESSPARRSGTRRLRCTAWRDDGSRASRALIVPEPDLLLEFLIIALDAPTQFGDIDQSAEEMSSAGSRASILSAVLAFRPFDQQPLFHRRRGEVTMSTRTRTRAKPRAEPVGCAFAPPDRPPRCRRQASASLDRDQIGRGAAAPMRRSVPGAARCWRPTPACSTRCRPHRSIQRRGAHPPLGVMPIAGSISTTPRGRLASQASEAARARSPVGLENGCLRHTRLTPPLALLGPVLRQIQR